TKRFAERKPILSLSEERSPVVFELDSEERFFNYLILSGRIKFKKRVPIFVKLDILREAQVLKEKFFSLREVSYLSGSYKVGEWVPIFIREEVSGKNVKYQLKVGWGDSALVVLEKKIYPKYLKVAMSGLKVLKDKKCANKGCKYRAFLRLSLTNTAGFTLSNPVISVKLVSSKGEEVVQESFFLNTQFSPYETKGAELELEDGDMLLAVESSLSEAEVLSVQAEEK
ncbi:MAG: hypothetical protein D6780_00785, partial [Candidatus Dadabacteria bacterium]